MIAVEFDAQIKNGTIEIPPAHRNELVGSVHVIVLPQSRNADCNMIDRLLANPLKVPGFVPLTRDEVYERD